MHRSFLVLVALCLLATACSSSSNGGQSATTTTEKPGEAVIPTAPTIPTTGKESVYVLAADPNAHTVTVDPIGFLTGKAATDYFKKYGPGSSHGPGYDYVIVNETTDNVVLPLEADAPVRVVQAGGTAHTDLVSITQNQLVTYSGLGTRPFSITTKSGKVTAVDEQFVP